MKKNVVKLLVVFITGLFIFNINEVGAVTEKELEKYNNFCKYVGVLPNNKSAVVFAYPKKDKVTSSIDDIEFSYTGEGSHYVLGSGEEITRKMGLFVMENSILYCPDKVIFCYDGGTNHLNKGPSYCGKNPVTLKLNSYAGQVKKYTVKTVEGTNEFATCKSGGNDAAKSAEKDIKSLKNEIDSYRTSGVSSSDLLNIKQTISSVSDSIYGNYCETDDMNDLIPKLNELINGTKDLVNKSESLSDEEKTSFVQFVTEQINRGNIMNVPFNETVYTCEGLLDEDLKVVIEKALDILRMGVPILLIVMVTIDFGQAVISNDQDAIKKSTSKAIKRAIAALAVFLIPTLVKVLLEMPGVNDWTSTDPDCGITTKGE